MERAGAQRTCPQRPSGGHEALLLRSELKVRSCRRPRGRRGLRTRRALPQHSHLQDWGGGLWGPCGGPPVSLYAPAVHEDVALTQAGGLRAETRRAGPEQGHGPGATGLSRKMRDAVEKEASRYWDTQILSLNSDAAHQIWIPQPKYPERSICLLRLP